MKSKLPHIKDEFMQRMIAEGRVKGLPDVPIEVPKRNKYGATKVVVGDEVFDSKKEYSHYRELLILQRGGHITELKRQVKFELIPKNKGVRACSYYADFTYIDYHGNLVVVDVKPYIKTKEKFMLNATFIMKQKLMLQKFNIEIKLVAHEHIIVNEQGVAQGALFIYANKSDLKKMKSKFTIGIYSGDELLYKANTTFIGPIIFNK